MLNLYFLSSWLPTVVRDAGYATATGVYAGTTLQLGGASALDLLGWLVNRYGFVAVLSSCFAVAALSHCGDRNGVGCRCCYCSRWFLSQASA
ncbi:MAG: hypothetical protein U0Y68_08530 [Blastocatellia bacterium]